MLNHTPDDRERENNLLLLLLLRAFVCVSEDALFEAKLLLFLKAKKEQSFGTVSEENREKMHTAFISRKMMNTKR